MFRWIDLVAQDYCVRSKYVPVQLVLFTRLLRTQQICSGAAGFIHKITASAADMFRCSRFYSQVYCVRSVNVPVKILPAQIVCVRSVNVPVKVLPAQLVCARSVNVPVKILPAQIVCVRRQSVLLN